MENDYLESDKSYTEGRRFFRIEKSAVLQNGLKGCDLNGDTIEAAIWDEDKMKKMKLSLAIFIIQEKYYESK